MEQYQSRNKKPRLDENLSFQQVADQAENDLADQFFQKEETGPVYESSRPPTPMSELSDTEKDQNDGLNHEQNFSSEIKNKIEADVQATDATTASIEEIVTRTVSQLADTIQSLVVPERLEREIQIADDWRNLCRAICNNARLVNSKLSFTKREDITHNLEGLKPDFLQPHTLTWSAFLQHPLSNSIWRLMQMHHLFHDDHSWQKWWKRVQIKSKKQPWNKLAAYMQALDYYQSVANQFWAQWSYNPTMLTVEDVTAALTLQGDWLRAAGINGDNGFRITDKLYQQAKKIAESDGKVAAINELLKPLWPSGFIPQNLHYRNSPFDSLRLETFIDRSKALVTWPLENYRFDPETIWNQKDDDGFSMSNDKQPSQTPSTTAIQFVEKMRQYSQVDESQRKEFMNFLSKN